MYRRILLALDPQGRAESALPAVVALARRALAEVVVVSVRDAETSVVPAEALAGAAAAMVARLESEGVRARAEVLSTHARSVSATIVDATHRLEADLVVLGSHGRGDLAGLLLGSVGHRVASEVDCPVLLVHDGTPAPGPGRVRRLLVAVDDSDEARGAVTTAKCLAGEYAADVMLAHALDHDVDAAYALLDSVTRLAAPGRSVEAKLLTGPGSAAARLAAEAERWSADLIVVGSRRLTDLGGLVLGSVAHELVRRTHRPVLLSERDPSGALRPQGRSALGGRLSRA